eukprot:6560428-Prymnesium_polylepis.4
MGAAGRALLRARDLRSVREAKGAAAELGRDRPQNVTERSSASGRGCVELVRVCVGRIMCCTSGPAKPSRARDRIGRGDPPGIFALFLLRGPAETPRARASRPC